MRTWTGVEKLGNGRVICVATKVKEKVATETRYVAATVVGLVGVVLLVARATVVEAIK